MATWPVYSFMAMSFLGISFGKQERGVWGLSWFESYSLPWAVGSFTSDTLLLSSVLGPEKAR